MVEGWWCALKKIGSKDISSWIHAVILSQASAKNRCIIKISSSGQESGCENVTPVCTYDSLRPSPESGAALSPCFDMKLESHQRLVLLRITSHSQRTASGIK